MTAAPNTKVYDGTTRPTAAPTITSGSLATGDTAAFTRDLRHQERGHGKTLTPAGSVNDGNGGNNYTRDLRRQHHRRDHRARHHGHGGSQHQDLRRHDQRRSRRRSPRAAWPPATRRPSTETYDTKNVGTGKTLTPAGYGRTTATAATTTR